jgi:hypothetical protein
MANWPLEPLGRTERPMTREAYLEKGHEIAVATFMPMHGRSELTLSMVREKPDYWKLDISDTIDASTIRDNLTRAIDRLASTPGEWPATPTEACRVVTHEILTAVYDIAAPGEASKGMSTKEKTPWGQGTQSVPSEKGQGM